MRRRGRKRRRIDRISTAINPVQIQGQLDSRISEEIDDDIIAAQGKPVYQGGTIPLPAQADINDCSEAKS